MTDRQQIFVDQRKGAVENHSLVLGKPRTGSIENRIDLAGNQSADLLSLFGEHKGTLVSLGSFRLTDEKSVFLKMLDGTGNIRFVLLADVAQFFCGQRFGFI